MPVQTSPAWSAWLEIASRLAADGDLAGVGVASAFSGKLADAHREYVYAGTLTSSDDFTATNSAREQTSTLDVIVTVEDPADEDGSAALSRVSALGGVLERILATDPKLGGITGLMFAKVAGWEQAAEPLDEGFLAAIVYKIAFRTYLRRTTP